jgi:signal peptidase I
MERGSADAGPDPRAAVKSGLVADVARQFGEVRLKVNGTSMLPTLWPGDLVTIRHQSIVDLQTGQIAQLIRNGLLVSHRVVRKAGDYIVTQGDSVAHEDAPAGEAEILGSVVSILRRGRPVDPDVTLARRGVSWILRRSPLTVRLLHRLGRAW